MIMKRLFRLDRIFIWLNVCGCVGCGGDGGGGRLGVETNFSDQLRTKLIQIQIKRRLRLRSQVTLLKVKVMLQISHSDIGYSSQ